MDGFILILLVIIATIAGCAIGGFIGINSARFVWRSYYTNLWRVLTFNWKPVVGEKWTYRTDGPWSDNMGHHAVIKEVKDGWVLYDKLDCRWEKKDSKELEVFISLYKRV